MIPVEIFLLLLLGFLTGFLIVKAWLRPKSFPVERQWQGRPFDANTIAPRIQQVRRDYVTEVQAHYSFGGYRGQLLASTRRTVASLPFFQRRDRRDAETDPG